MYRSIERSPQDTPDGFDLYSAQASFAWLRVDLVSFEVVKSAGFVSLAGKVSLVSISDPILFLRS